LRDSTLRQARATTVVSQPPRFSTPLVSERLLSEPGLLDGVVGLAQGAEHAVGDRRRRGRSSSNRSASQLLSSIGHIPSSRLVIEVTDETREM
jgi:hypothetical protein